MLLKEVTAERILNVICVALLLVLFSKQNKLAFICLKKKKKSSKPNFFAIGI